MVLVRLIDMGRYQWGSVVPRALNEMNLFLMRGRITVAPETVRLLLLKWLKVLVLEVSLYLFAL